MNHLGLASDNTVIVEANPTPDVPQGKTSTPVIVLPPVSVSTTTKSDSSLPWVLGGLILTAGAFAAYTYSKKHHRK